ncbi:lipopolysaccharide biosynthesis protein [Erythrobacter sp. BLCC-B19]|uniref:lipopolysaccharide biosynthesis protein n=1 Tax=Erythrobacter sp. BLCC-B19 TaxID=3025315 RepID=UPI00235F3324|nr:lipopolysaccharide biosynthesis protein [Erythrobacter sp. BLCC-B19]WDA41227.1 lipopolysaccharide biosynthesis protein [Erythrobacter sp. BLCC-B19]
MSAPAADTPDDDLAALAKGGRTNTLGFVVRLIARIPFLVIATRLYGAEALGRFASALVLIEIVALICALGEKRGLAQRLSEGAGENRAAETNLVYDGLLLALGYSAVAAAILLVFPEPMFPNGMSGAWDIWLVATIPAFAVTEILLAAQAYRFDIATTVRARAVVEPWTISIGAGVFFYIPATRDSGLALAYIASIYAGLLTALWPFLRTYGLPRGWAPHPAMMARMSARAFPLVGADAIERGTRLLDIFILGLFAPPQAVGIYYAAQQIASLPQKLKTSFEPILSPVITKNLRIGNMEAIAAQVRQVGFWIIAIQLGIALVLGVPGEAVMGLWGPDYVAGTAALAFLLAAEVVASMAVVSESVLVYIARKRNLAISVGVIALQGLLTIALIEAAGRFALGKGYEAAGAAGALMIALATSSLVKALLLKKLLGAPVSNWRWPLAHAAAAAVVVGYAFTWAPEWVELVVGVPAVLATYALVIWRRGFDEADKVLFRKQVVPEAEAEGRPPA